MDGFTKLKESIFALHPCQRGDKKAKILKDVF
jgi:hypothetical protein